MNNLTLGSLFDGSGGFPLGGMLAGITPVWASEIEPFGIRVTTKRIPFMKHYGDISKMDGSKIEPVDIITFGSPCQDMSVAGKRSGLDGKRSSLFYEAVRIIKEMRNATNGEYPRYIVWENVPGAFSSNKGEDFKSVLETLIGIVQEDATVSSPSKGWPYADAYLGDGWSLAYRVLDAQYWGVPQRRRRIFLVADLRGGSAPYILFKSEGLSRYSAEGFRAWQRAANGIEKCSGTAGIKLNGNECPCKTVAIENHAQDTRFRIENESVQTITKTMGTGGNNGPLLLKIRCGCEGGGKGALIQEDKSATLACNNDQTLFVPSNWDGTQVTGTLTAKNAGGNQRMPDKDNFNCILQPFGICSKDSNAMKSSNPHSGIYEAETSRTLDGNGGNPSCNQGGIAVVCIDQGGGKSSCSVSEELSPTLACTHGGEPAVCIQGSMIGRADNTGPRGSGINEDVSFTLNTADRHAVISIDRESFCSGVNFDRTPGISDDGINPTITSRGPGAVCYAMTMGSNLGVHEEKCPTLLSRDYKDPNTVCYGIGRDAYNQGKNAKFAPTIEEDVQPTMVAKGPGAIASPLGFDPSTARDIGQYVHEDCSNTVINGTCPGYHNGVMDTSYTVRRLTPTECARLQGFPDWWCKSLEEPNPTDDDINFWFDVWNTYSTVTGLVKPKTEKQVRRWLEKPYSDSSEYKLWGNGVALPCVFFVLAGIVYYTQNSVD